jgi:LysM repeat protein
VNTRAVSQPVQAMAISAIVLATLLGGFILAVNDRNLNPIGLPNPIGTLVAVVSRTPIGTQVSPPGSSTTTIVTPASTETITPTPTPTLTPTPVCALPPIGWMQIVYSQSDMTLPLLAQRYNTTVDLLRQVNCLDRVPLQPIQLLYVPMTAPTLAPTPYLANCDLPFGWPTYIVQWGDTLSKLSARYNVSIELLMRYNCLTSTLIYQGQRLYVPYVIPVATITPFPTWTLEPTWAPTPVLTSTLTWTPTPINETPSDTPTPPPSLTWTPPSVTATPMPSITPTIKVTTGTPPTDG